jgi:AcrR family transcriptional regulator
MKKQQVSKAAATPSMIRLEAGRPTGAQSAHIEQRLRRATLDLFIDRGFHAVAMADVAKAAGITKRTLYARYRDKNALFADAIIWALARYRSIEPLVDLSSLSTRQALLQIARSALSRAVDPAIVGLNRLAMFEAADFPHFAAEAYSAAWHFTIQATTEILTAYVGRADAHRKLVNIAAAQFTAIVGQGMALSAAFGMDQAEDLDEGYLECAVDMVLNGLKSTIENR